MRWLVAAATAFCVLPSGGCSYRLASILSKDDADVAQTGAISRPAAATQHAADPAGPPPEADLIYARAAASDALASGGKDGSVPWQNPNTGAGGNITPLATSYSEGGVPCRDFLASYVHGESQAWLQGAACRTGHGKWQVKSLKPFTRS